MDAESRMLAELSEAEVAAARSTFSLSPTLPPEETPFCQLAHHEVSGTFTEELFSYSNISKIGGPVGFAGSFEPIFRPPNLVVFPLSGLLGHLRVTFPARLGVLHAQGEPERFLSEPGASYGTAEDFLLAGTLACIHFASRFQCAFVIRW